MAALYDTLGRDYASWRRPDPQIAAAIHGALGDARSVVNVGAGTGSYEPAERSVVSVEPSSVMIAQRPPGAAPVVRATGEALPFAAASFDASLAVLTLHHWPDWRTGAAELRRVARRRAVVLTHDWADAAFLDFWLVRDYLPQLVEAGSEGAPEIDELCALLGGRVEVVPVPAACTDGFLSAYWQRPEIYLNGEARAAISAFHWIAGDACDAGLRRLSDDLASGRWADRNAELLDLDTLDLGYRLVVAELA